MLDIFNGLEISLSEINKLRSDITIMKCYDDTFQDELNGILRGLGMDTNQEVEKDICTHRNRFNEVVTTLRFTGRERIDEEWLKSGYASKATKDKALNSPMLRDMYFLGCGLVESV